MNIMRMLALIVVFFMLTLRVETVEENVVVEEQIVENKKEEVVVKGGVKDFMRTMSRIESNHKHDVVNQFGMMGKYQFSPKTIKTLGFDISNEEFLNDPKLQDEVMIAFMKNNRKALRNLIKNYHGKVVNDVLVTEAGILAGAHLVGPGGVLAFFYPEKYPHKTVDGNGTSVVYYMNKFKHYDVSSLGG
jgi:hypothetical protein